MTGDGENMEPLLSVSAAVLQGLLAGGADKTKGIDFLTNRAVTYAESLIDNVKRRGSGEYLNINRNI